MSDFKAKMHKIRLPLGLRPRPEGAYGAPQTPLLYLRGPTSKGMVGEVASVYFTCRIGLYLYFSTGNGQPTKPALCQLYRHTFVPYPEHTACISASSDHSYSPGGANSIGPGALSVRGGASRLSSAAAATIGMPVLCGRKMRKYGTELLETNYPTSLHRGPDTWMVPFCWQPEYQMVEVTKHNRNR